MNWARLRGPIQTVAALNVFCLAAMMLYAGTVFYPLIWDDHTYVTGQPFLMDCGNLPRVLSPRNFSGVLVETNSARPVWLASILLDTCAGGGATPVYRVTSIFWHAMDAMLVLALTWTFLPSLEAAAAAGILFAAHPVHAETVGIITYRSDLLCLAFMLGALILYRHRRLLAALACAALALLSKEMAVVLPLLALLADACFPNMSLPIPALPGPAPRRRVFAAALVALVAAYMVFHTPRSGYALKGRADVFAALSRRVHLPSSQPLTKPPAPLLGIPDRFEPPSWNRVYFNPRAHALTMFRVFGSYLRLLAWPNVLQGDYSPKIVNSWRDPGVIAAWLAWLALLAAAWALRRAAPLFSFGIGWTIVSLLPVSGLVPILNLEAERYIYVASAGWCMAIAGLLQALARGGGTRRGAAAALLAILAVAGGWRLVRRNRDFRSDRAYYEATLAADPGVERAHLSLAIECVNEADALCADKEFRESLRLWPGNLTARLLFIDYLHMHGRLQEESAQLGLALAAEPENPGVLLRIGLDRWRLGRREEAAARLRAAVRAAPEYWLANEFLGILLLEMGHDREAAASLREALWKSEMGTYHLCVALRRLGRFAEAESYLAVLSRGNPALAAMGRSAHPKLYPPQL